MGGVKLQDAQKCTFVINYTFPALNERIADLPKFMPDFAVDQNIRLFDVSKGICHQLVVERDLVRSVLVRFLSVYIQILARMVGKISFKKRNF